MCAFCQGYQIDVYRVSITTMEGTTEAKNVGVLLLIPFSGCGAPLVQTDKPFPGLH